MKVSSIFNTLIRYCIPFFLLTVCCMQVLGQQKNAAEEYNVDSTLYAYYLRCKAEVMSPVIIQMTDTLFHMAGKKGDQRMQAVALTTRLDHFYFEGTDKDSIHHYVNIVKEFSKKTKQPKYYYFAWSKRLINYYIKQHQYNTALYEADKMMKEAEHEGYPAGMANGYNILSSIYQTKNLFKLAAENREKEIEIILKYKVDTYNLSNCYSMLSDYYCSLKQMDKAKEYITKAREHIYSNAQQFYFYLRYANYYLTLKEYSKAKEYLQKAGDLMRSHKEISNISQEYYNKERDYYMATQQFNKALATQEYITNAYPSTISKMEDAQIKALIYHQMGNLSKAVESYQTFVQTEDSLNKINEDIAASEFAAMLGVERLNTEKSELLQEVQQRDLANKTRIIIFLVVLLILGFVIFYREHLLNGKLRISEKQLSAKNNELLVSERELLLAKEQAEKASKMKTEFIQSMSHEIRTPLNSIVGFSQIISSMNEKEEETKEYAQIIEQGSNNLLQLVEDVLDLASLDSGTAIPTDTLVDITTLCRECIVKTEPYLKPGVSLGIQAEQEAFYLQTNPNRLFQILCHLLRNATKFTQEGYILLEWHTDKEQAQIVFSVTDTGVGIPADKHAYIFERFTKLDTFAQGTGLGLSIGRICSEKMGGSLSLDSGYTDGSRFILTLPLQH